MTGQQLGGLWVLVGEERFPMKYVVERFILEFNPSVPKNFAASVQWLPPEIDKALDDMAQQIDEVQK